MQPNKKKARTQKRKGSKKEVEPEDSEEWQDVGQGHKQAQERFILYKLLNVEKTATMAEIKSSYKQLALQIHPDKNKEDPQAGEKFSKLTEAYKILTNKQKRQEYDETGLLGGDFDENVFQSAYEYYRQLFKKIEKEDIQEFQKKYRFGEMEKEDLINYYNDSEGHLTLLLQSIPLSVNEDIPRFIKFYEDSIKQGILEETPKFLKTKNKVKKMRNEEKEAMDESEKRKQATQSDMSSLVMAIQGKKTSFIDMLEQKYAQPEKEKKKKKV